MRPSYLHYIATRLQDIGTVHQREALIALELHYGPTLLYSAQLVWGDTAAIAATCMPSAITPQTELSLTAFDSLDGVSPVGPKGSTLCKSLLVLGNVVPSARTR